MSQPLLSVRRVSVGYDLQPVVRDVDLELAAGETVGLLGGNGSGKSTLLAGLAGLLPLRTGAVLLDGRRLDRLPAERRVAAGLALLPQARRVFGELTVRANLEVVELAVGRRDLAVVRRRRAAWLERFPILAAKLDIPAATLSGGEQQLLAIGRVLSTGPRVLLLDEPSAGLSGERADTVAGVLREQAAEGVGVVLVEQDVGFARALADRLFVARAGVVTSLE